MEMLGVCVRKLKLLHDIDLHSNQPTNLLKLIVFKFDSSPISLGRVPVKELESARFEIARNQNDASQRKC